jgi:two-component system, NtrC family, response regulator AtoC
LLKHFMTQLSEQYARPPLPFSPELLAACANYPWPGNLRELNNFVKRYLVLGDEKLAINELQPRTDGSGGQFEPAVRSTGSEPSGGLKSLARSAKDEAEAEAIAKALDETNWNRKQAAALLQISYKALLYKIRQYGLAQTKPTHNTHKLSAGA